MKLKVLWGCILIFGYFVVASNLAGCGRHAMNPMSMRTGTSIKKVSEKTYPPHSNKVFVTKGTLPESVQFDVIAVIMYGKSGGGKYEEVFQALADDARKLGADAVIETEVWKSPRGTSWSAPQGRGRAIKILDKSSLNWSQIEGNWF